MLDGAMLCYGDVAVAGVHRDRKDQKIGRRGAAFKHAAIVDDDDIFVGRGVFDADRRRVERPVEHEREHGRVRIGRAVGAEVGAVCKQRGAAGGDLGKDARWDTDASSVSPSVSSKVIEAISAGARSTTGMSSSTSTRKLPVAGSPSASVAV